jgi:alkylation response protein AidB-like acyl-CoA dehydrogenase
VRLSDSRSESRFRAELTAWLADNEPAGERVSDPPRSSGHVPEWAAAWQRTLLDAGWLMPRWPPELGGREASAVEQMIYLEELSERRVPRSTNPQGLDVCAPTLADHGAGVQLDDWLPATLAGRLTWCVAVDEIDAPADGVGRDDDGAVGGLSMAELGDTLSLSGTVAAPPGATDAARCLCAAQLAVPGRDAGADEVAVVAVDLEAPGVERPAPGELAGAAGPPSVVEGTGQLTFTDVRIARDEVVGGLEDGWHVIRSVRARQRSTRWIASLLAAQRALDALVETGRSRGLAEDGGFRDALAGLHVDVEAARALAYRALSRQTTRRPNPDLALLPLVASQVEGRVYDAGVEVLGADGVDRGLDGPLGWHSTSWADEWGAAMVRRARSGGFGVERDRVAARILGQRSR